MATGQISSIYGMGSGRRIRTPYINQIRSAYGQATADVISRKKREREEEAQKFDQQTAQQNLLLKEKELAQDKAYQQRQLGFAGDQLAFRRAQARAEADAAKRAMGMNIGTLGMNIAGRAADNSNLRVGTNNVPGGLNLTGGTGINLGSLAGSGLAGYGAYKAMGGGGKGLAAGIGAGLLTDAVSGGGVTQAIGSGLGSLPGIGGALSKIGGGITDAMDWIF